MTLFTLVFFVGWSILTTILAAVFFVQADDNKKSWQEEQQKREELVSSQEQSQLPSLIGKEGNSRQSWIGTLLGYQNQTLGLLMGLPVAKAPARDQTAVARTQVEKLVKEAQPYIKHEKIDPNTGAVGIAGKLVSALDAQNQAMAKLDNDFNNLSAQANARYMASQQQEKELEQEKETYHQQALDLQKQYNEIKTTLQQDANDRVNTLLARIDEYRQARDNTKQDLLRTQEQLAMAQKRLGIAEKAVTDIQPDPNKASMAYIPDGKITSVDEAAGVVYINLGKNNRVYKGLTFSVYDKGSAIPRDGKAKAEIEIFKISDEISMARIVSVDPADPIVTGDIIGNLIWDQNQVHQFVITGDFDLNMDGAIDPDAQARITALIKKWGGAVTPDITAKTTALLLGQEPKVPPKPTAKDLETDPQAQDRYEAAQKRLAQYEEMKKKAQSLMIPAYDYETFLYLIGYKGSAVKAGAF